MTANNKSLSTSMASINRQLVKTFLLATMLALTASSCAHRNSETAGTFAPDAYSHNEAVIQVYSARTWGAKKVLSVHTWVSIKPHGSDSYTSYEIIGWRLRRGNTALVERNGQPDRDWWGNQPQILLDVRGEKAERLIPQVIQAVNDYPFPDQYQAYPGPNSNTFTAFIGRKVPELGLDLPSTAIGKDYRVLSDIIGTSATGTGIQTSLWGLLGLTVGIEEGIELNVLGLNLELDLLDLAIELPGIGRIGPSDVDKYPEQEAKPEQDEGESQLGSAQD